MKNTIGNAPAGAANNGKGSRKARPLFYFASVDQDGRPQVNAAVLPKEGRPSSERVTEKIPYSNFYVDRNHYDVTVADPVLGSHYFLHNLYYMEDGIIYLAGIVAKFAAKGMKPRILENSMAAHFTFGWEYDAAAGAFRIDEGGLYSVRFNPDYFSQERSLENFERVTGRLKVYEEMHQYISPYDRPRNYIQRAFFIDGALSVRKLGLTRPDHAALSTALGGGFGGDVSSPAACYFSLEQFYLSGVSAALNFYKL